MASSRARPRAEIGQGELVFLLALLQALHALAIDAMLPALGAIGRDLQISEPNHRQLIVGVFLFGLGLGTLFPGPLADRYGRRPVILACLFFYIVPMLACALVTEFNTLIALRCVQAVGCSGLAVVPSAIIRDRFEGDRMARLQSMISVIFMLVPMIAPTLGQAILEVAGWRWIFGLMAGLGTVMAVWTVLRLPETLAPEHRQERLHIGEIGRNMGQSFVQRDAIGYVVASALMLSAGWGFINSCQQLVGEHFGAGDKFPLAFALIALSMSLASFTNARIVVRFGTRRVSHTALLAYIAAAAAQTWMAFGPHQTLWQFLPVMAINMALVGFMGANFGAIALQPFARTAGATSSAQSFFRTMLASIVGAGIGQSYDGTARPIAMALLGAGCASLLLVLYSEKGRLFRRLNPPPPA